MILVLITIVWSIFFWRLVKWLRQVANGHKHLQVAAADAFAGGIRTDCDQVIRNLERLRQNMIRLENQHAHNETPSSCATSSVLLQEASSQCHSSSTVLELGSVPPTCATLHPAPIATFQPCTSLYQRLDGWPIALPSCCL